MAAARRDTVPPSPDARRGVTEVPLLPGQELRDEFTCPITRALMRVPVIAADGHTYCRAAIERWLLHHSTSPKTGEPLGEAAAVVEVGVLAEGEVDDVHL